MRNTIKYGLSLGSNVGDRMSHLSTAREAIAALPITRILASAPVYETEPVDSHNNAPLFLNTVLLIASAYTQDEMLPALHAIEEKAGRLRQPDIRNAARTLDIDIIFAEQLTINSGTLIIPHPRWAQRRFVVQPLSDICPDLVLPRQSATVMEILKTLPLSPTVRLVSSEW